MVSRPIQYQVTYMHTCVCQTTDLTPGRNDRRLQDGTSWAEPRKPQEPSLQCPHVQEEEASGGPSGSPSGDLPDTPLSHPSRSGDTEPSIPPVAAGGCWLCPPRHSAQQVRARDGAEAGPRQRPSASSSHNVPE